MDRLPTGFWKIDAYTNGYQIIIMGVPKELPEGDSLAHSCDQMGCGSLDHVVAKVSIDAPLPELEWTHDSEYWPSPISEDE